MANIIFLLVLGMTTIRQNWYLCTSLYGSGGGGGGGKEKQKVFLKKT